MWPARAGRGEEEGAKVGHISCVHLTGCWAKGVGQAEKVARHQMYGAGFPQLSIAKNSNDYRVKKVHHHIWPLDSGVDQPCSACRLASIILCGMTWVTAYLAVRCRHASRNTM